MSAWMEIVNAQGDDEWLEKCSAALEEVQRETLRRAATKIRDMADRNDMVGNELETLTAMRAADLIDPEVE